MSERILWNDQTHNLVERGKQQRKCKEDVTINKVILKFLIFLLELCYKWKKWTNFYSPISLSYKANIMVKQINVYKAAVQNNS